MGDSEPFVLKYSNLPTLDSLQCVVVAIDPSEKKDPCIKSDFQWQIMKTRLLLYSDDNIIACPHAEDLRIIHIVSLKNYYPDGRLNELLKNFSLEVKTVTPVAWMVFRNCLMYHLTVKLSPEWNRFENYFIRGKFFLAKKGQLDAVELHMNYSEDGVILTCYPRRIWLHEVDLSDLDFPKTVFDNPATTPFLVDQTNQFWVHVLPSFRKGRITYVTNYIPPSSTFREYTELRNHWKNTYGYRLPAEEKGMIYVGICFFGRRDFLYPLPCVRTGMHSNVGDPLIMKYFTVEFNLKIPSICGVKATIKNFPDQFEKTESEHEPELQEELLMKCSSFIDSLSQIKIPKPKNSHLYFSQPEYFKKVKNIPDSIFRKPIFINDSTLDNERGSGDTVSNSFNINLQETQLTRHDQNFPLKPVFVTKNHGTREFGISDDEKVVVSKYFQDLPKSMSDSNLPYHRSSIKPTFAVKKPLIKQCETYNSVHFSSHDQGTKSCENSSPNIFPYNGSANKPVFVPKKPVTKQPKIYDFGFVPTNNQRSDVPKDTSDSNTLQIRDSGNQIFKPMFTINIEKKKPVAPNKTIATKGIQKKKKEVNIKPNPMANSNKNQTFAPQPKVNQNEFCFSPAPPRIWDSQARSDLFFSQLPQNVVCQKQIPPQHNQVIHIQELTLDQMYHEIKRPQASHVPEKSRESSGLKFTDEEIEAYGKRGELKKVNIPSLIAYLRKKGIPCKSKDKKNDLLLKAQSLFSNPNPC